eukprot:11196531-Lingulodinium_polyedra.AAC.1
MAGPTRNAYTVAAQNGLGNDRGGRHGHQTGHPRPRRALRELQRDKRGGGGQYKRRHRPGLQ